jgi:sigma-B regulation protein RsbU (phosphoserine phosphatase)
LSSPVADDDLADLVENLPCGYLSLSPDGRVLRINATLVGWLASDAAALVGQSIHALLSFGGRIAYETHLAPMLRLQGKVDEIALDLLRSDGGKLPVIANATEKRANDGTHVLTRVTLFKAVERRAFERTLVDARTKAEAAASAEHDDAVLREQFIAVLGHDLRNPLAALDAGVRMIGDRETLSDRGRFLITEMAKSVGRAAQLIDNVLDFARGRLGNGISLTRNAQEPLGPVIEQVVNEIRVASPERRIITSLAIEENVDCDRARIAQLASNLIANAVTHGAPEIEIEVSARTEGGNFILCVSNGGAPIPPAARAQLFQPFFRGAVRRSQQGLGLGLFIVNEIAKAHGGTMEVTSSDAITQFVFSMPLTDSRDRSQ